MTQNNVCKNIENSQKATRSSRYQKSGLTTRSVKLSSKNFSKLMSQRGLSREDISALKASAKKNTQMKARHAKKGEKFVVTHGDENASGVFVSKKSLGNTPEKRINKGALPHSNSAKNETKVVLDRDQNLVYSKIGEQSKFRKMDPAQGKRKGGGQQVITDGGFKKGAIRTNDAKYPVPVYQKSNFKNSLLKTEDKSKSSNFKCSLSKCKNANKTDVYKSIEKGQQR